MPRDNEEYTDSTREFEDLLKSTTSGGGRHYVLRLYVTGSTSRSAKAISTIRALCDEYLSGHYDLKVVDIYQQPTAAQDEQIIAAPTLIKSEPLPPKRLIGDLSNRDRIIVGLDLTHESHPPGDEIKWVEI